MTTAEKPFLVLSDCEVRFFNIKGNVIFEVYADGNLLADGTLHKSEEKWAANLATQKARDVILRGRKA